MTSTFSTTEPALTRTKARKQAAKDSRKEERDQIRDQKRQLRDLRYIAERQTIPADLAADFWQQLIQHVTKEWDRPDGLEVPYVWEADQ